MHDDSVTIGYLLDIVPANSYDEARGRFMPQRFLPAVFALCGLLVVAILWLSSPVTAAIVSHFVISEVQISGDGATPASDEFVELYNPANTAVVMDNWKLTRKNSAGTEANLVASLDGTGYNGSTSLDVPYSAPSNALTNNYTVLLHDGGGGLVLHPPRRIPQAPEIGKGITP